MLPCLGVLLLIACRPVTPESPAIEQQALAQPVQAKAHGADNFPALTGRVVDGANLLSPSVEERLAALSSELERQTTDQLVVVTVANLEGRDISEYSLALGRAWRVGQRNKDNGVLLVVAPSERKVRIEVGCGLEAVLTNADAANIIQHMLPEFRDGHGEGAVQTGASEVVAHLQARREAARTGGC